MSMGLPVVQAADSFFFCKYRPVRLQGVELSDPSDAEAPEIRPEPVLEAVLGEVDSDSLEDDLDSTAIKLDRNYEYTIWLSYAEVYNEKVYDLLESVQNTSNPNTAAPRSGNPNLLLTRQALTLKPSPPSDGLDSGIRGKYISGLKQFRVHSAAQAKALVKLGQMHRRVFGTLANRESSRSHGMVLLKIVRGHRGERNVRRHIAFFVYILSNSLGPHGPANLSFDSGRPRWLGANQAHSYHWRPTARSWKHQQIFDGSWTMLGNLTVQSAQACYKPCS